MPVEIRELIIKTSISINERITTVSAIKEKELDTLKKQLLDECKRMIAGSTQKSSYKR